MQIIMPWHEGEKPTVKRPTIVFVQGSAWKFPNVYTEIPQLSWFARKFGYVIATVTHRSCLDGHAFPGFLQDVKTAIRFLRAHADEYGVDVDRIGIWGTSSGANTALMVGLTGDDPQFETDDWAGESSAVKAVVDCFGPPDVVRMNTDDYPDILNDNKDVFLTLGGGEDTWREKLALVSPIRYVKPGLTLPPFLLLHGDADELVRTLTRDLRMMRMTGAI
jgi:acetyl esterase/lipase